MKVINTSSDRLLSMGTDPLVHIRQLRSKFNQESTYSIARVYGEFTQNHTLQPFTIYILSNSIIEGETDSNLGSKMMELVAHTIHEDPQPKLLKKDVISLLPKTTIKKQTKVSQDIQNIISLFQKDEEIEIIENTSLSPFLRYIADTTTNGLKKANDNIITNIWNKFRGGV